MPRVAAEMNTVAPEMSRVMERGKTTANEMVAPVARRRGPIEQPSSTANEMEGPLSCAVPFMAEMTGAVASGDTVVR
jgi:hypothetical protein